MDMQEKLKSIDLLLLDVDGVLTDGGLIYDDNGCQIKKFNSKDGLGIRLLLDFNIKVGIITGRSSKALTHRCQNLGITLLFQGIKDKAEILKQILKQTGIPASNTAFMGDDLPDLPVMKQVGIPIAVSDAHQDLYSIAAIITSARGGHGAVREICEAILKSKGLWSQVQKQFE